MEYTDKDKRINRNDRFCTSVKKKDVLCVLSGVDTIQCEAAHIVPLNGEYGQTNYVNPTLLNDSANGMMLSKELHYLYDQFIWSINPYEYTETDTIPKKRVYNIEIISNYKEKNLSINNFKHITIRAECHHFIEIAYLIFIHFWNPGEQKFKKLECKPTCVLDIKSLTSNMGTSNSLTTIDKLGEDILQELRSDLNQIIICNKSNKRNFNKKMKQDLGLKYNLHEQSIDTYYKKIKKEMIIRNT